MSMVGKRSGLLALVLVMATALVGSAYTLWYEDLQLSATVATAELDASITCSQPVENESTQWPEGGLFDEYPIADPLKQVASVQKITPQVGPHEVELTVSNAYPGYAWDCEIHIFNTAPVPWHLETIEVIVEECDENGANCQVLDPPPPSWTMSCVGQTCKWGDLGINPPNYPNGLDTWSPLYIALPNWQGCQVHEEDSLGLSGSLVVGVNQSAKENTVYKITLKYRVQQWNESKWHDCRVLRT